jgi:hypothetical protein
MIFGIPLTTWNPVQTSLTLLPDGHLITVGAKLYRPFITLRVALKAVARLTSNFSHMDLKEKQLAIIGKYS